VANTTKPAWSKGRASSEHSPFRSGYSQLGEGKSLYRRISLF